MAYNITLTDGTAFASIADGTVNTTSSVTLVGKNYAGYGEFLDENFIQMLENYSSVSSSGNPTASQLSNPLTGQLWWDKTNSLLKVYNGTIWKTISAATASATQPASNVTGDLWYDTTNQQVKVYTGNSFIVVGPAFTSSEGTAGAIPGTVNDSGGSPHFITSLYVNNNQIAIVSQDASFTPQTINAAYPTIYPGITVNKTFQAVHAGNLINNGNLTLGAGGTTVVATITSTGANVTGYVNATGNVTGGNILSGGLANVTGTITGGGFVTSGTASATGNITGGNVITGGAISAVGAISATANVTGGNVNTVGVVSAGGNITGGNVTSGGLVQGATVSATANVQAGNLRTTGLVSATGSITGANVTAGVGNWFIGDGGLLSNISAAVSVSQIQNGTSNVKIGGSGSNVTIGVTGTSNVVIVTNSQTYFAGNINVPGIEKSGSNAVGNIGSSANYFNQVFATATTALYADVAERFEADELLDPGTVVELGGEKEITRSRLELSENVFGVISTRPAFTMNGGAGENDTHPAVAMTGRVPVKVVGQVRKGDRLVSAGAGIARAAKSGEATSFNVIGRSLVAKTTDDLGTVEAIVNIQA
jgi:hypothetical protein